MTRPKPYFRVDVKETLDYSTCCVENMLERGMDG